MRNPMTFVANLAGANELNVSLMTATSRSLPPRPHPDTSVEYEGDNPLGLAQEIDAALDKYGVGNDRRMCKAIHFFEGELRLIAECLRYAGPQKVAKQPRGSTDGVATQEEIEKYLKHLKRVQAAA
jgi:hypothetical protein